MSDVGQEHRSFLPIEIDDLKRLEEIARKDREDFFQTHPNWAKAYGNRYFCVALCQGAAKHFVDHKTGVNDFDVYTFYKSNPNKRWYAKRKKYYDFGNSKFGKSKDKPEFKGRRVDCLSREIPVPDGEDVIKTLRRYLVQGKTETARLLAVKAVVLLDPFCGEVVWP